MLYNNTGKPVGLPNTDAEVVMKEILEVVRSSSDGALNGVSDGVVIAMILVVGLICILAVVSFAVSVILAIAYCKYNRRQNSIGLTGERIARGILDRHGLSDISVSQNGSMLFGNSYSHYFRKVRLRRLTWKKTSITALAMATQKSALAILDQEGDPDMRTRVRLTPMIYFGPLAFVPLVIIGVLLDYFIFKSGSGTCTIVLSIIGLIFYIISFIMSLAVLKTETKAQKRALRIMRSEGLATSEETEDCKKLYRLYNIEYVNNMVMALLELIYRVLQIVAKVQRSSSSSSRD